MRSITIIILLAYSLSLQAQFFSVASATSGVKTGEVAPAGPETPLTLDSLNTLGKFAFFSNDSISNDTLFDLSGNDRHATLTSNIVSDPGGEFGSTLRNYITPADINANVDTAAHSGTRSWRMAVSGSGTFKGVYSQKFLLLDGEEITYSFWYRKSALTSVTWVLYTKNGTLNSASGNLNTGAVGNWVQKTATVTVNGTGEAYFAFISNVDGTDFLLDDFSITVTGETNNCFHLPVDATLAAKDFRNYFYQTTTGAPITIRADWSYPSAENDSIYCGGATSYIFLTDTLDVHEQYVLATEFEDLDFPFDSCPTVLNVGSGQTYADIQDAINSIGFPGKGTILDRYRVDVHSNLVADSLIDYDHIGGGGYDTYLSTWNHYFYVSGIGDVSVTTTKEATSTDADMASTQAIAIIYSGGFRNLTWYKSNGGYFMHIDASSNQNREFILKNIELIDEGSESILEYRRNNTIDTTNLVSFRSAIAGGFHNNVIIKIDSCNFESIMPITFHDINISTGGGRMYMRNSTLVSHNYYDSQENPDSEFKESLLLTNYDDGRPYTLFYMQNCTLSQPVNKVYINDIIDSISLLEYQNVGTE